MPNFLGRKQRRQLLGKASYSACPKSLEEAVKLWLESKRLALLVALAAMLGCADEGAEVEKTAYQRGHDLYRNICLTCHNKDPKEEGSLGPAVANASLELLQAKILRGEYPAGHKPMRGTQQMPKLAYLGPHLPDLAAFLAGEGQGD
jgi:mono/diheme cytochrome c family protein